MWITNSTHIARELSKRKRGDGSNQEDDIDPALFAIVRPSDRTPASGPIRQYHYILITFIKVELVLILS